MAICIIRDHKLSDYIYICLVSQVFCHISTLIIRRDININVNYQNRCNDKDID